MGTATLPRAPAPQTFPARSGSPGRVGGRRSWPRIVASYFFTLWVVVTLVFALPRAMPGDPLARFKVVDYDTGYTPSQDDINAVTRHYGLDRPLVEQYVSYLNRLAHGDLGRSISHDTDVRKLLRMTLPWTLLLVGTALVVSTVLSFVAGVAAGWGRGRAGDRVTTVALTVLNAIPDYALAMLIFIVFGAVLEMFPLAGAHGNHEGLGLGARVVDIGRHLALPALTLACSTIGAKYLIMRNTVISVLGQDYMVLARAKGLPENLLKYRHASRNALLPFLNIVGVQVGVVMGGAVFVENMFAYPGVAGLLIPAVRQVDYPLIEGGFLLMAFVALTANLVIDLISLRVDPRVRR